MSAQQEPVVTRTPDLGAIAEGIRELARDAVESEDTGLMASALSLELALAMAIDTRRIADELHRIRRAK